MNNDQYSNAAPLPPITYPKVCAVCGQALEVGDIIRLRADGTAAHEACLKETRDD